MLCSDVRFRFRLLWKLTIFTCRVEKDVVNVGLELCSCLLTRLALRMQYLRVALCLTYVLLRRASFPFALLSSKGFGCFGLCPRVSWDSLKDCRHFWSPRPKISFVFTQPIGVEWSHAANALKGRLELKRLTACGKALNHI